jgi:asparagine synthase (glutamine-hydrolysing)
MSARLVHRGPDDEGTYRAESGVTFAARRLSIIDVAGGHQPLSNEDGSVWVMQNGEIYNHRALRDDLVARGHRFATGCDTEVLAHLYEEHGDAFVHALDGMYAIALWDVRRERLLLARDRFGEKPLFLHEAGGHLTFASELGALAAAVPGLEVDPLAVDDFLVAGYVPGHRTMYAGVRQLPPGHVLTWRPGERAREQRYWAQPDTGATELGEDLVAETHALLRRSVARRLVSDVPLGVFLSGGKDSTLIAALAAEQVSRLRTFTVGYDVGSVNELEPARASAAALGTDHHELVLTEDDVAERVPRMFAAMDQPLADQALIAMHAVSEFARREVTVVVGGEGADELFGGYPRYGWLARSARVDRIAPTPAAAAGAALAGRLPGRGARIADVLRPRPVLERHLDWVTSGRRHGRAALYGPRLRAQLDDGRVERELAERAGPLGNDVPRALMRLDLGRWLVDDVLVKADRAGMLASLEIRTPFLERTLAELAAAVPTEVHLRGGGKHLLRSVLERVAPGVRQQPKTAFRVPAADWLRRPLAGYLREQLTTSPLVTDGWIDGRTATALVDEHLRGADHTEQLWPLLAMSAWFAAR